MAEHLDLLKLKCRGSYRVAAIFAAIRRANDRLVGSAFLATVVYRQQEIPMKARNPKNSNDPIIFGSV
jgi:hypothetical protein